MKSGIHGAALLALGLAACAPDVGEMVPEEQPAATVRREAGLDVLLVTVDTLRADALGSYGSRRAATPWMDRLAAEGVRFTHAHTHNVVTLPTHASILSGLLPPEHGVRDNSGFRFPGDVATMAGLLGAAGYRTGAFVSAFPLDSRFGLDRDFEVYEDSFTAATARPAFFEQERAGTETVALARQWLAAGDGRPSFCWVHLYEPHFPYAAPEPFASRFRDSPYAGEVAAADAALQPLLGSLLAAGEGADTLVVLTSDHGEALGEHGEATHGIFAYEASLRVPLILYQPRLFAPRVVGAPARHVDLLPTVLDALGLEPPPGLAGLSLLAAAAGEPASGDTVTYFEALSGQLNRGWAPLYGVIRDGEKFIDLPIPELYSLPDDPGEKNNLAPSSPARVAELRRVLATIRPPETAAREGPESAENRRRLAALGYVSAEVEHRESYSEADDPKRLMALDAGLREVAGLHAAGDLAGALARCRELVRQRPGMRMALIELAQLERESGDLDAAILAMRRALALSPKDPATLAGLAAYLTQAGRPDEAAALTEPHSELAAPDVEVLLIRGLALGRSRRFDEALAAIARAEQVDSGHPSVFVHRGTVQLMAGRRDLARAAYERALELNPRVVSAHTALAVMALEEDRTAAALNHWRAALGVDPREHRRLLAMALGLWNAGRVAEARPLLELFVSSAPPERYRTEIARVRSLLASDQNAGKVP